MNILKDVIQALTKEEVKNYKVITFRSHSDKNRKDLRLFDLYRQRPDYSEDHITLELFGKDQKNAFYRLKNKVHEDINKSLFFLHAGKDSALRTQQLRELARKFEQRQYPQLAFQYLDKSDKLAKKNKDYKSLIQIYRQIIDLSQQYMEINPEPYIEAKKKYEEKLHKIDKLDELIATIKYRIHRSYNLGRRARGVLSMLQQTINEFSRDKDLLQNRNNQLKLYQAISSIMIQNQDYSNLATYVEQTYEKFEKNNWFTKENHEVKLRMLAYLINAYYKLGEYQNSLQNVEWLEAEMKKYKNQFYQKYLVVYYNGLLINYMNIDPQKGLSLVEYIKNNETSITEDEYPVLTLLNPALLYYYSGRINKALNCLQELFIHKSFSELEQGFQLKTQLVDLMITFEDQDMDVLDYKTDQFKKNYGEELQKEDYVKEQNFFAVFDEIVKDESEDAANNQYLQKLATDFIKKYRKTEKKSDDLIPYDEWLSRNLQLSINEPVYQ